MKRRNKHKFGKSSERRFSGVSDYLILTAKKALVCSPVDFGVPVSGGLREDEEQHEIFLKGFSKCDGYKKKSFHQKKVNGQGQALDLVPYIAGSGFVYTAFGRFGLIGALMLEAFEELQEAGNIPSGLFLHWGGLWSHKNKKSLGWDLAHYEIRSYEQEERV